MQARAFWKLIVADRTDFLDRVIELLTENKISFCVLDGQAVNAYAEPVVSLEDVLQGKIWAALDPGRRPSKRQKDLADIARLIELHPALRQTVPQELLARLV